MSGIPGGVNPGGAAGVGGDAQAQPDPYGDEYGDEGGEGGAGAGATGQNPFAALA